MDRNVAPTYSLLTATETGLHLLALLQAQGIGVAAAVPSGALFGPVQVGVRVIERAGGGQHPPLWTVIAALGLMATGLESTLPLVLFRPQRYAPLIGRPARPSLIAQAVAPTAGALLRDQAHSAWIFTTLLLLAFNVAMGGTLVVSKMLALRQLLPCERRRTAEVPDVKPLALIF